MSNLIRNAIRNSTYRGRGTEATYVLKLGKRFGGDSAVGHFFCNDYKVDGHHSDHASSSVSYSVVVLPDQFHTEELTKILEFRHLELKGIANTEDTTAKSQKTVRRITFLSITGGRFVEHPLLQELRRLKHRFQELEEKNWTEQYTSRERKELANERNSVSRRLDMARESLEKLTVANTRIRIVYERLIKVKRAFIDSGIGRDSSFPNKMVFVQNPHYAAAKSTFSQIIKSSGLDESLFESLMAIDQIGLVNVSTLYERWCLLKIIGLLTDVYGFTLTGDWEKRLINAVSKSEYDIEFSMECASLERRIRLTYEKRLASGKRPDFVLDVQSLFDQSEKRFVLDAKFKDRLSDVTLSKLIEELYSSSSGKNYSEDRKNKVFVLHPSSDAISERTSPLDWGGHSDYGQSCMHRYGGIYLSPSFKHGNSLENLQRLLGLILDDTTGYDYSVEDGPILHGAFCLACGETNPEYLAVERNETKGGGIKWSISCRRCNHLHVNNFCSGCRTRLKKHGYYWTYHRTRAEQPFNIVCPNCHAFLVE